MKPLGDRRARIRLEVLGTLKGTLEMTETARLINISNHGALIETSAQLALGSFQELQLNIEGKLTRVAGRVRRLERVGGSQGQWDTYLVGLEFLSPSPSLTESIEQLTRES